MMNRFGCLFKNKVLHCMLSLWKYFVYEISYEIMKINIKYTVYKTTTKKTVHA